MTHSYVSHDSFICVTWLIHMCDMTHSYVWHDSFICMPWPIHMCAPLRPRLIYHWFTDLHVCVTWLIHMCVWHDSFICVCDITHSYVCVAWLIHMCDMTHSYDQFICALLFPHDSFIIDFMCVWHNSYRRACGICAPFAPWLIYHWFTWVCDMTHPGGHVCDMTNSYVHSSCPTSHLSLIYRFTCVYDMTHLGGHVVFAHEFQSSPSCFRCTFLIIIEVSWD